MKKGLLIACAIVLAPVLLIGLVAFAASDWRQIGSTSNGDQILVSTITRQKNGLRSAWVRIEYKEPTTLPQGGPFVELRARARFNCTQGGSISNVVTSSEWFYSRDHSGKLIVSKKARHDDVFGQAPEGNFATMTRDYVCSQK